MKERSAAQPDDGEAIDPQQFDWSVLPPGTETYRFPAPSGELAVAAWGPADGTRVICLPGTTGSKEDFSLVGPLLAASGYRVVSIDLAGQYESHLAGPPAGGAYDLELYVRDTLALLGDGEPVHLIGYSFAGIVAQQIIARAPQLLRSATFLSTPPLAGDSYRGIRVVGAFSRIASPGAAAAIMMWGVKWNLNRATRSRHRFVRQRFRYTRRQSVADTMAVMMNVPDVEEQIRASGVPCAVAIGHDDVWSTEAHAAYAERIGARLLSYPTGHAPMETLPTEFAADLLDFFAAPGSGATGG